MKIIITILLFTLLLNSLIVSRKVRKLKSTAATCGAFGALLAPATGTATGDKIGSSAYAIGTDSAGKYVKQTCYTYTGSLNPTTPAQTLLADCSCFVGYMINGVNPAYLTEIGTKTNTNGVISADIYQQFFAGLLTDKYKSTNWAPVKDLRQVKQGDILAWSLPPGSKDTGHVMVVINGPGSNNAVFSSAGISSPSTTSTSNYIYVADASDIKHINENGPRSTSAACASSPSNQAANTGVGSGQIIINTDEKGYPISFQISQKALLVTTNLINAGRAQ